MLAFNQINNFLNFHSQKKIILQKVMDENPQFFLENFKGSIILLYSKPPNDTKNTFILIVENIELMDSKSYFFYFL